ncbi:CRISPR-associated endonuclease Cas1 [Romboutsia maritimum]|uniref:CRISPR-associated endonuclease Cas1 n=1 Tax=Romboutsia maritimum TaxID=2020948 RepID=A0A371ITJ0_9FIRM|nr:CRISPR-associated endonuclease Cas1 [Romboutsia maritimum]RDY23798.1 CRISPR-associated endonuclease Cas1 [Romboutsia maritimum]
MQLVINTLGTNVSKNGDCFKLKYEDKKQELSAKKVEQILITSGITITSDAMELALENDIDIVMIDKVGNPLGRLHNNKMGSISTIRKNQLKLEESKLGTILIKEILSQKINNQIKNLRELSRTRNSSIKQIIYDTTANMNKQLIKIQQIPSTRKIKDIRLNIQGHEGSASRMYFSSLSELLPKKYKFECRSQRPAKDEFNCMLNYGYGIMYSNIEKACVLTGLDPYIGIMHVDNYNKKTFVFDLIEMYRGYIDKIVFKVLNANEINEKCFDINDEEYYLNTNGKQILITKYMDVLKSKIRYKERNIEFENIIRYDCQNIANRILKES